MKSKKMSFMIIIGSLLTAIGSTAVAQDMYGTFTGEPADRWQEHTKSTKTRAEVMAELEQARAQEWDPTAQISTDPTSQTGTSHENIVKNARSGDEVRAEAQQEAEGAGWRPAYRSVGP